uniref:Uncharacterized protein n=1 Tax=Tetradesmus obliquus TaxID=3088 RepID=A0A383W112_TETOB|eukprot:jgi/Sobl393_1/4979/SZX70880.1
MLQQLHMQSVTSSEQLSAVCDSAWRLQQLRHVSLGVGFYDIAPLLQLTRLPALQHVRLEYEETEPAVDTAPAWKQLPQLQELQLLQISAPSNMQTILAGVSGATSLTHLMLTAAVHTLDDDNDLHWHSVAACASLTGLSRLQGLRIASDSMLVAGDALALTALTGLAKLDLSGLGDAVGDVAATALACNLRQLRHLHLTECGLGDMVCLAAIRNLTQLTELRLEGNDGITQQRLMLLTGLSSLQQLRVDESEEVTAAVLDEFWAAVQRGRQQQQQQQRQR